MRFVTLVKLVVAACVAFAIALVAVVKTIDVQQYRLLVTDVLHAATGRTVQVLGDFELALSLTPRIVATNVVMANPSGTRRPELMKVARIEAEIGLLPLLRREVEVLSLTLVEPDLALEIDEAGRGNWHLPPAAAPGPVPATAATPATRLRIHGITVQNGRLVLQDRSARSVSVLSLNALTITAADAATPIAFTAKGQFGSHPLDISGTIGSFAQLDGGKPFPVKLQASAGGNQAVVEGSIGALRDLSGLELKVSLQGSDVAVAAGLVGHQVPPLGPYRAALKLTGSAAAPSLPELEIAVGKKETVRLAAKGAIADPARRRGVQLAVTAESDTPGNLGKLLGVELPLKAPLKASGRLADSADGWHLADARATVGRSDLAGEAIVAGEQRPLLTVHLASKLADLADFGLQPAAPLPKAKGEALFRDDALLPLTAIDRLDIEVTWRADRVVSQGIGLTSGPSEAMLALRGGVLTMRPFTSAAADAMSVPPTPEPVARR